MKSNEFGGKSWYVQLEFMKRQPQHTLLRLERLNFAKELGFDFVEMSIDERDERLARLDWSKEERLEVVKAIYETGVRIPSICFSRSIVATHWVQRIQF